MSPLDDDAQRLHRAVTSLTRRYQFRDRDEICCHGITVTQCYALNEVAEHGPRTMGELAEALGVTMSAVSRAVEGLVARDLVTRSADLHDRRVIRATLTGAGQTLLDQIHSELVVMEREVLAPLSENERSAVIAALETLNQAIDGWRARCACAADGATKECC
jgi:DNA-binding MarR family transcriptional regulator